MAIQRFDCVAEVERDFYTGDTARIYRDDGDLVSYFDHEAALTAEREKHKAELIEAKNTIVKEMDYKHKAEMEEMLAEIEASKDFVWDAEGHDFQGASIRSIRNIFAKRGITSKEGR